MKTESAVTKPLNWHSWLIMKGNPDKTIAQNMDDYRKYLDSFNSKQSDGK